MLTSKVQNGTSNTTNITHPVGFLTWWTIHQGVYDLRSVKNSAAILPRFPTSVYDMITGEKEKAAWLKATAINGNGIASGTGDRDRTARYLTRNLRDEERLIIRELLDKNYKVMDVQNIAVLGRDGLYITADIYKDGVIFQDEVVKLITEMQEDMDNRIGRIDDTRIRQSVLNWLDLSHRVAVRGSGGVYFVPVGKGKEEITREEILAVRQWIGDTGIGTFSVIQLVNDGTTSIDDFRTMALEELLTEIQRVNDDLGVHEDNDESTPGRAMRTATLRLERIQSIGEKINTLEESLTGVLGTVQGAYQVTLNRAKKLYDERAASKFAFGEMTVTNNPNAKSGTAKQRDQRVKI